MTNTLYIRGQLLHFFADPAPTLNPDSYQFIADGLLIVEQGKIIAVDSWDALQSSLDETVKIIHYPNGLIVPGFIDTHIHFPQTDMIAANTGSHLLEWLNTYTFPFEQKFHDSAYANEVAHFFINELLKNGTTTALVFATIHPESVDAIFTAAEKKQMRLISGKTLNDQNLPDYLSDDATVAYQQSLALIERWHKKPGTRLLYALSPRFAPAVSPTLFEKIEQLKAKFPDIYVHTHISENVEEIAWTKELFQAENYLSVYDQYKLLGKKTVLAHGVHLTESELGRIAESQSNIAFCPTSNLFLGSGLFNYRKVCRHNINIGLGTDIGAGTSFSIMQTLNEAYKVLQLQNQNLSALTGFYLATLGGAKALDLADKLGNFMPGKEADFVVLDFKGSTPLLQRRLAATEHFIDKLFALMMLGDERSIVATYVNGQAVYQA